MCNIRLYFSAAIITLVCCYQIALAGRITWDEGHTPIDNYGLNGEYSSLRDVLRQDGFEVDVNNEEITVNSLWDTDILIISVLSNFQSAYTVSEVERISSFVAGGGGLIILSDNSQMRPQNLELLVNHFGMSVAAGDNIGDLTVFADHEITQGIENVTFINGSAVTVGDAASILGTDESELAGLAINDEYIGAVILLGDADAWSNQFIGEADNLSLALNTVRFLDSQRQGAVAVEVEWQQSILIESHLEELEMIMFNNGEGILETGISIPQEDSWIDVMPRYAQIEPGESLSITVEISAEGLEAGEEHNSTLTIFHNQPDVAPLEVEFSLIVIDDQLDHFEVPDPTGIDHSILINNLTVGGLPTHSGVEIGAFSEDGMCVGGVIYMSGQAGLAARGDDPFTDEVDGFVNGETMHFKLFTLWDGVELETSISLIEGEDSYQGDGFTILNLDGRADAALTIDFNQRWNLISLNLRPPSSDFQDIFAPLLDAGLLRMVKDGNGHFWNVERNFSNLGDWDITQGYYVQVNQFTELEITGLDIDVDTPIRLTFGWSIIPFLPNQEMAIEVAVNSISDQLIIAKRDDGGFYIPEWDWDGIGTLLPAEGYQVKLSGVSTLIYPVNEEQNDGFGIVTPKSIPSSSGIDMSVLLIGLPQFERVKIVDSDNQLVGTGESDATGRAGISTWGDDKLTGQDEGLNIGESFYIILPDVEALEWLPVSWLEGTNQFSVDGLSVGRLRSIFQIPSQQAISISPNPFNSIVTVRYANIGSDPVNLSLYDITGKELARKSFSSPIDRKLTEVSFSTDLYPAGVILIKFEQGTRTKIFKSVHLP